MLFIIRSDYKISLNSMDSNNKQNLDVRHVAVTTTCLTELQNACLVAPILFASTVWLPTNPNR